MSAAMPHDAVGQNSVEAHQEKVEVSSSQSLTDKVSHDSLPQKKLGQLNGVAREFLCARSPTATTITAHP